MSTVTESSTPAADHQAPTLHVRKRRTIVRLAAATLLAIVVLLVGRFYVEYKTFDMTGDPERITYSGRHYLPGEGAWSTRAQIESDWGGPATTVGRVQPLPVTSLGARDILAPARPGCTTLIAVAEGKDQFREYVLSGGC